MKHLFFILISISLFSCNEGTPKNTSESKDSTTVKTQIKTPAPKKYKILLSNVKTHCFSDSLKQDTFRVVLIGDSLKTAQGIFSITSYKGSRIYADTFSGGDLTKNVDGDPVISENEKLDNIRESVKLFFTDSAFSKPPTIHEDGNETIYWGDIKSDKTAIGFEVIMNHMDFRIAYSKKRHKVLMYWDDGEAGD